MRTQMEYSTAQGRCGYLHEFALDRVALFALPTGLRVSELCDMKISDISYRDWALTNIGTDFGSCLS
jgi:integrase